MLWPHFDVILASASPRRRELLARSLPEFDVIVPTVDEEGLTGTDPWQTALDLAWAKAIEGFGKWQDAIVIGADTVVAYSEDDAIWTQLAKPKDSADAARMLGQLSERRHAVITSVAMIWPGGSHAFTSTSWVTFRSLTSPEIDAYVRTGEPLDKAGAYAIQGGARSFVAKLEGHESTVVGLPIEDLEAAMVSQGIAGVAKPIKSPESS